MPEGSTWADGYRASRPGGQPNVRTAYPSADGRRRNGPSGIRAIPHQPQSDIFRHADPADGSGRLARVFDRISFPGPFLPAGRLHGCSNGGEGSGADAGGTVCRSQAARPAAALGLPLGPPPNRPCGPIRASGALCAVTARTRGCSCGRGGRANRAAGGCIRNRSTASFNRQDPRPDREGKMS
jgi:hypothetical protein